MKAHPFRTCLFAVIAVLMAPAWLAAESVHPRLAPLHADYEKKAEALKAEREQSVAGARQIYERALAAADKTAAAERDLKTVAGVAHERQALAAGLMAPEFPAELPASLQDARRDYLAAVAKAAAALAPRLHELDAEYLADLAKIEAGSDPELARQLAAEKQRVIEEAGRGKVATAPAVMPAHSVVVNGDFSLGEPGGAPKGWEPAYPTGCAKVVPDGANTVLRLEVSGKAVNAGVKQDVPIPAGAHEAAFRAKMRGKPKNLKQEPRAAAQITLRIRDAKGQMLAPSILTSKHSVQWQTERRTIELPPGAKSIEVVVRSIFAVGTFDFDDVALEFK